MSSECYRYILKWIVLILPYVGNLQKKKRNLNNTCGADNMEFVCSANVADFEGYLQTFKVLGVVLVSLEAQKLLCPVNDKN